MLDLSVDLSTRHADWIPPLKARPLSELWKKQPAKPMATDTVTKKILKKRSTGGPTQ